MEKRVAEGDRSARAKFAIVLLAVLLGLTVLFSLASGASDASAVSVVRDWLFPSMSDGSALSARDRIIVYDIRLPRVVLGVLIGSALAVSGAVMQGLFRNPLADPGLVGVSAGAGLGAIVVIVLGGTVLGPVLALFGIYTLPLAAFSGGLATTLILYRVATRRGQTSIATMLLAGIALGAMAGAFSGIMVYLADDRQLRDLTFWGSARLPAPPGPRSPQPGRSSRWRSSCHPSWHAALTRWRWGKLRRVISAFRCSASRMSRSSRLRPRQVLRLQSAAASDLSASWCRMYCA